MATFGTAYDFSITANDLVKAAMIETGQLAMTESPGYAEYAYGRQALNMLVKSWAGPENNQNPGLKMWLRERATLTLTAKAVFAFQKSGGDV